MVVSDKAAKLDRLMELLGSDSQKGGSMTELCAAITSRKNKEQALPFAAVPYAERLVILPHCLRATGVCKAEERSAEYACAKCHACKIATIVEKAEELGYLGVRILKGGSAVAAVLEDAKPRAVLGVACNLEGALGSLECERAGIPVQFVSLARDGCADTDVDTKDVIETMEFRQL